jgi:hypothetical protein
MFLINRFLPLKEERSTPANTAPVEPTVATAAVREVPRQALAWVADHFEYEHTPFTGLAVERWPNGKLKQRWPMEDGKWHGLVEEWDASGQQRVATNFDHGARNGKNTYWNPDGSVQKMQLFDHNNLRSEEISPPP